MSRKSVHFNIVYPEQDKFIQKLKLRTKTVSFDVSTLLLSLSIPGYFRLCAYQRGDVSSQDSKLQAKPIIKEYIKACARRVNPLCFVARAVVTSTSTRQIKFHTHWIHRVIAMTKPNGEYLLTF